jgi:hypothetical protein
MKKITLWLFALFTCWQMSAQVGAYSFTEGVSTYAALGGTNITATGDDSSQDGLPIGFTFTFGGTNFTTFSATTNGWIRLGNAMPASTFSNSAANFIAATHRPIIAPMWDDNHRNTGAISYSLSGVSPNQVLTVDYNAVNIGGGGATSATNLANYQIKLYETTNVVEFHYGTMATAGALSATICLSDVSGFQSVTPGAPGTSSNATANHAVAAVTNVANKMYRFAPPACSAPGGIIASNLTTSTATLSWNAAVPSPSTGYEYVVSTSNVTPAGSGTPTTNISEPITLLSAQTVYYVFVRSNCGGVFSSWSTYSFLTPCSSVTSFTQNFGGVTAPALPSCWTKVGTTGTVITQTANASSVPNTLNMAGTSAVNMGILSMQPVSNLGAGTNRIVFDMRASGTVGGVIEFGYLTDISNASSFVSLTSFTASSLTYANFQFSPPAGTYSDYIAFRHTGVPANSVLIDNVRWEAIPVCADQTGLTFTNVTATGVETSWDDLSLSGVVGYQYAITTSATPPASGTATNANVYVQPTGLTPQTVYYLHVRSECAGSTYGNWATISFTTSCLAITTLPHVESFDAVANPSCWTTALITGTTNWAPDTDNDGVPAPRTGTRFAGKSWVGNDDALLISPAYDLAAYPTNQARINVWIYRSANGLAADRITFHANTTNNLAGATQLLDVPLPITQAPTVASAGWYNYIVDVPLSFNTGGNFYIIAQGRTTSSFSSYGIGFDDYALQLAPTCPDQTGLTFTNVTATGVETSWDDMSLTGAIGYEYAITTSATPPASGTATPANVYVQPTGLTPQTVYYLHVRSECASSTYGNWATISFTTSCLPVVALPWSEGFEGLALGNNIFPSCWGYSNTTGVWNIETTPVANTGANSLGRTWSTDGWAFTPNFTLTAGVSYRFSYYMRTVDAVVGYNVTVGVGTGQNSAAMTTTLGTPLTGFQNPTWTRYNFEFTPGTTGDYSFGVRAVAPTSAPNGINFDDFRVELSPTCPDQTGLTFTNVTATGVETSWDDMSLTGAVGYEYAITTSATPPASGTATNANVYVQPTGLSPQTVYYLHVRSECAGSTYGNWATISFTTSCVAITTLPHTESFDAVANPNCWTTALITGATNWAPDTANDGVPAPRTGTRFAGKSWDGNDNALLISPAYDLSAYSTSQTAINVWIYRSANGIATDRITFYANTSNNLTGATQLLDIPLPITEAPTVASAGWYNYMVDVPLTFNTGGNFYIIAQGRNSSSFSSYGIGFDDYALELSALSSDSFDKSSFVAYPNPVKDVLYLSYKTEISNVRIVNLLGQEVLNTKTNTNDVQVNMSALTAGAYIVNITVEDTVHTIKVIKE